MMFIILLIGAMTLVILGLSLRSQQGKKILARLTRRGGEDTRAAPSQAQGPVGTVLRSALQRLLPAQLLHDLHHWLGQAGLAISETEVVALHIVGGLIGGVLALLIIRSAVCLLVGMAAGVVIPFLAIRQVASRRAKAFDRIFGDAVVLMTATIRSGFALRQAMQVVADEMPNPVAEEFKITLSEINMGLSQDEALSNLAKRMPNEDLDLFVTAVLIQADIGGDLSSVLEKISSTIRERVQIRNEVGALTAQGKMSGIMVAALPVFILIAISSLNPHYTDPLFHTQMGQMILLAAVVMEGIGGLVIRKLIQVDR